MAGLIESLFWGSLWSFKPVTESGNHGVGAQVDQNKRKELHKSLYAATTEIGAAIDFNNPPRD